MPSPAKMQADEAAALTRLVISYCLGRGLLSRPSGHISFCVHHPPEREDYAHYQWKRMKQLIPNCKEPSYVPSYNPDSRPGGGSWRLRVGSRWFETAWNLLYSDGYFHVGSHVLELVGAEAIAALWADRGRIQWSRRSKEWIGRLSLLRYPWDSAQMVHDWIYTLTGALGRIGHHPNNHDTPMIHYPQEELVKLLSGLSHTWMAQAPSLEDVFRTQALRNEIVATGPMEFDPQELSAARVRNLRRSHCIPQLDPEVLADEPPLVPTASSPLVLEPPVLS